MPGGEWRHRLGGALGLTIVATGLTLAMAAPALLDPANRLFGSEIVGRHPDPYIVIHQFENPSAPGLYTQPATDYLGAVIAAVTGDGVSAYNVAVLATFPLAALFAYLLALRLSGSRAVGWLAGLFYAFAPFHVAHCAYHPHGAQTQWLPLYVLALWLCLERGSVGRLLLLVLSAALVVLSNFYYGLIAAILTPVALAGFWLAQRGRCDGSATRNLWLTVTCLALIGAIGIGYVALFAPTVLDNPSVFAFSEADLRLYGARWWSYLVPPIENPLVGGLARGAWERHGLEEILEQQVSLGLGLLALAAVALAARLRGARDGGLAAAPALVLIGAVAFFFSRAPDGEGLVRPAELVYRVLPMFRAYARFGLVVFLVVAVLAAIGAVRLLAGSRRQRFAALGLLTIAAIELTPFPPFRWRHVLPTAAHRWLNERPAPVRLLSCAPATDAAERALRFVFKHEIATPSGRDDCADPGYVDRLSSQGFTHLLARRSSPLEGWLGGHGPSAGLAQIGSFEEALLYEVLKRPPPRFQLEFGDGFHWRQFKGEETYRWMRREGRLTLSNTTEAAFESSLDLILHAFPEARTLEVELDGAVVAELDVAAEPRTYRLGPMAVAPGRHTLMLRSRAPAVVAHDILGNGDRRELSVAIWGWSWEAEAVDSPRGRI